MSEPAGARARHVVVVGASAGGIPVLQQVLGGLPVDLDAAVAVVLHRRADSNISLAAILQRGTPLPVHEPTEAMPIVPGAVYVAPRDRHLQVRDGVFEPAHGPKVNFSRPAVDVLFRSAAEAHAGRVIGVLLTGWGQDGVVGLNHIKRQGGVSIVQEPDEAAAPSMPLNGLRFDHVDFVLRAKDIAPALVRLTRGTPIAPHDAGVC
jgi:two-component system chemotaxis response regulator CheB